ncbi:hypothetical protein Golob_019709 [Gossypium lobatum]|uniref:Uncharacterized protein n=1 Tax=Gossypium lobatum TaxID=34289 RepID=A0A7J8L871_9ROSI|nr:hypothetical protein [Gossypium lobatum]
MEGRSNSSCNNPPAQAQAVSELETLQKVHEEKTQKIQHLNTQIQALKLHLHMKKKKNDNLDEKKLAFHNLTHTYNTLREEYNALLGERSRDHNPNN